MVLAEKGPRCRGSSGLTAVDGAQTAGKTLPLIVHSLSSRSPQPWTGGGDGPGLRFTPFPAEHSFTPTAQGSRGTVSLSGQVCSLQAPGPSPWVSLAPSGAEATGYIRAECFMSRAGLLTLSHCPGLNGVSQIHVEALTSSTSECDCVQRYDI